MTPPLHYPTRLSSQKSFQCTASSLKPVVFLFQISPFPFDLVGAEHQKYDNAQVVWAQEEPMNMGYWTYVSPRLLSAVGPKPKIRFES